MINANEARELTKNSKVKIELNRALLDAVNDRIKHAANNGKKFITLNSFGDNGCGIRGIKHYLSKDVTNELCMYLILKGFNVDYDGDNYSIDMTVKVSW